jgi:hypothetical protein
MFDITSEVVELLGYGSSVAGGVSISAESDLAATATRVCVGQSAMAAEMQHMGAYSIRVTFGQAALTGDLSMSGTAVRKQFAAAAMSADVSMTLTGTATRKTFGQADVLAETITSFLATASPVFRLRMATAKRSITDDWLLRRYPIDAGLSLLVKNGAVTEVEVPSQTELAEADYYFLGGRDNPITPAQRATLIAACFGSYIEED